MKKVLLTAGICIATLVGVQAQSSSKSDNASLLSPAGKDQVVAKMMSKITANCHLSDDQTSKVKPIVEEFVDSKMANNQKFGKDKASLKAANQTSVETMNSKMNAILNADQQKALVTFEQQKMTSNQKTGQKVQE